MICSVEVVVSFVCLQLHELQLNSGSVSCRRKLPVNPNMRGVLTDKPDYSYLDGRPAEIGLGMKRRMEKNIEYAVSVKCVPLLKNITMFSDVI